MRKTLLTLAALSFAALAFPVIAQEDEEITTIVDVVVESAGSETPEFATLLAAIQLADPAILEALANPDAELTVFAPTDGAFAALQTALGSDAYDAVLADQELLSDILLFHVVPARVLAADVVESLDAATELGFSKITVPTLQGQYLDIIHEQVSAVADVAEATAEATPDVEALENEASDLLIDGARLNLSMIDIETDNGVIHVIDAVLLPDTRTIAEIVTGTAADGGEFSTLLAAVQAAAPAVLEALAAPESDITVFAPTDAAFAALGDDTLNAVLADQELLTAILLYHVAGGTVHSDDLASVLVLESDDPEATPPAFAADVNENDFEIETLNGQRPTISVNEAGEVYIDNARVIITDIDAINGVIHVIDAVILPST